MPGGGGLLTGGGLGLFTVTLTVSAAITLFAASYALT